MKTSFKKSDIFKYMIIALVAYLSKQVTDDHLFDSADDKKTEQSANEEKQEDKTQVFSETVLDHDYVDLGLSVMWATCNVGAENPWDYGDYFAWGETEQKEDYTSANSTTYGVDDKELKGRGVVDDRGTLTPDYDAASVNWGSEWRMPTYDEQRELLENCKHSWTKFNGVYGIEFTGKNGNFVFFPAAGCRDGLDAGNVGRGGYWSSSPGERELSAHYLSFREHEADWALNSRDLGFPVRAVLVQK